MPAIEAYFTLRKKNQDVYQCPVNEQVDESAGFRGKRRMNRKGKKIQHLRFFLWGYRHVSWEVITPITSKVYQNELGAVLLSL
jgi:hypothetical protein